jgi:hypothetical protein
LFSQAFVKSCEIKEKNTIIIVGFKEQTIMLKRDKNGFVMISIFDNKEALLIRRHNM